MSHFSLTSVNTVRGLNDAKKEKKISWKSKIIHLLSARCIHTVQRKKKA